jgi:hypothetical protein
MLVSGLRVSRSESRCPLSGNEQGEIFPRIFTKFCHWRHDFAASTAVNNYKTDRRVTSVRIPSRCPIMTFYSLSESLDGPSYCEFRQLSGKTRSWNSTCRGDSAGSGRQLIHM